MSCAPTTRKAFEIRPAIPIPINRHKSGLPGTNDLRNFWKNIFQYPLKLQAPGAAAGVPSAESTGISAQEAESALRDVRRLYTLQIYDDVRAQGYEIPDELFDCEPEELPWRRPLIHIVMEYCQEYGKSPPHHVQTLYEKVEKTKQNCDEYRNVGAAPVWLAICMNSEENALIPTLIYSVHEYESFYTYPIESPRDLIEIQKFLEFTTLALPASSTCLSRIRESANNKELYAEWQRTVGFLYYHPLHKRYEQDQHIRQLLAEEDASGSAKVSQ